MIPIWKKIFDAEAQRLASRSWRPGELFATASALAQNYGVSPLTARRVLKELSAQGQVKNVPSVGCVIAAPPKKIKAYFLSPEQLPGGDQPLMLSEMMKAIFEEAVRADIDLVPISEVQLAHLNCEEKAALLYLYNLNLTEPNVFLEFLPANIVPMGAHCPRAPIYGVGVGGDHAQMMRLQVEHLHQQGCGKIAYVGPCSGLWFGERFHGYLEAMRQLGVACDMGNVCSCSENDIQHFRRWYDNFQPDGICTPAVQVAEKLVRQLSDNELVHTQIGAIGIPTDDKIAYFYVKPDYHQEGVELIRALQHWNWDNSDAARTSGQFKTVAGKLYIN